MNLASLAPGCVLRFSHACPLPQLAGSKITVQSVRTYLFGTDSTISYTVAAHERMPFHLTIAEDNEGYYLAISRLLSETEQDQFFGRDALSFFSEPSSAKTIRCKADMEIEGAWVAQRYSKTVDWISGMVTEGRLSIGSGSRHARQFHYNLLADESGEKALEIEHYAGSVPENKIYLTVYRPVEDIESIAEPIPHIPVPQKAVPMVETPRVLATEAPKTNGHAALEEPPLFVTIKSVQSAKPDFRRVPSQENNTPIHIGRPSSNEKPLTTLEDIPPLPSFLMSRENSYLSLDEILAPETERVRCDLNSAKILIDTALSRRVHVREIMRDLLGLESQMGDEAVFELPLTDNDYRLLAQRYKLKPDKRSEIRACLQEELRLKLLSIAKG